MLSRAVRNILVFTRFILTLLRPASLRQHRQRIRRLCSYVPGVAFSFYLSSTMPVFQTFHSEGSDATKPALRARKRDQILWRNTSSPSLIIICLKIN